MTQNIIINESILSKNDRQAQALRAVFAQHRLFVCNLMSSPGSGKTSLLESFAKLGFSFAVIEGDLQTNRDTERLQQCGILSQQISTGDLCHLDAQMVADCFATLSPKLTGQEILFIENVGNLVCPASYDVGAHVNIVLLSVSEGDDKVLKYPTMFLRADCVLVSKVDLLPHFVFETDRIRDDLAQLGKQIPILPISTKDDTSIRKAWDYLVQRRAQCV